MIHAANEGVCGEGKELLYSLASVVLANEATVQLVTRLYCIHLTYSGFTGWVLA